MKNSNSSLSGTNGTTGTIGLCAAMMLCVAACNGGSLYIPQPEVDSTQMPLSSGGTTGGAVGNANDANTANPAAADLSGTAPQAPASTATIDGNAFVPRTVFYASGQDPQNNPVLLLVVSDQNDWCTQVTGAHQLNPGAQALWMYLYTIDGSAGGGAPVPPTTYTGTYAVFDSSVAGADVSRNPGLNLPSDAGLYVSGMFDTLDMQCAKSSRHQLAEGRVAIGQVDAASAKLAGSLQVQLDDNVALGGTDKSGSFVAVACPALLDMAAANACMLP